MTCNGSLVFLLYSKPKQQKHNKQQNLTTKIIIINMGRIANGQHTNVAAIAQYHEHKQQQKTLKGIWVYVHSFYG